MTPRVKGTLQGRWTLRRDRLWLGIQTVDTKLSHEVQELCAEAGSRIDRNRNGKPKKDFRRSNESERLRRFVSRVLFGNTDDLYSIDWELVLSSSVIQLRSCITWLAHVPHARVLFLHGCCDPLP